MKSSFYIQFLFLFVFILTTHSTPSFGEITMPIDGHLFVENDTIILKASCENGLELEGQFPKNQKPDQLILSAPGEQKKTYIREAKHRESSKTDKIYYDDPIVYGLFVMGSTYLASRLGRFAAQKFQLNKIRERIIELISGATGMLAGDYTVSSQPFDASTAFDLACMLNDEDFLRHLNFRKIDVTKLAH